MTNQSFKKTDFLSYGGPIAHTACCTSFLQRAVSILCQRSNGRICISLGWEMFVSCHILMLVPFKEAIRSVMLLNNNGWDGGGGLSSEHPRGKTVDSTHQVFPPDSDIPETEVNSYQTA